MKRPVIKQMVIRMPADIHKEFKEMSKEKYRSMSYMVIDKIKEMIDQYKKDKQAT